MAGTITKNKRGWSQKNTYLEVVGFNIRTAKEK
jgi:hypothetical protein